MKKTVCVIFGGKSSEHDISLLSAASVISNLDKEKYDLVLLGITKDGRWLAFDGDIALLANDAWAQQGVPAVLSPDAETHGLLIQTENGMQAKRVDAVFPVLHGRNGEDGTIQGLLELAGIPYVGCGVLGSAVCMDKIVANQLMDANGIARCEWDFIEKRDADKLAQRIPQLEEKLGYPMFVKPANAGSSVGITKAHNREELLRAAELAFAHDARILFERNVTGQEVECAVMGNEAPVSTLPGEILASAEFYTFDDKYIDGTSTTAIPAHLSEEKLREVQSAAQRAYTALCCKGLSRVDFFVESGTGRVLLNEINTLPGFTSISMYPKLMMDTGLTYSEVLDKLLALAWEN